MNLFLAAPDSYTDRHIKLTGSAKETDRDTDRHIKLTGSTREADSDTDRHIKLTGSTQRVRQRYKQAHICNVHMYRLNKVGRKVKESRHA